MEDKGHIHTHTKVSKEMVDHPQHYGGKDDPFEHVKVMEHMLSTEEFGAAMFYQITKYLWRAGKKNDEVEDLKKAAWYLQRWITNAGG